MSFTCPTIIPTSEPGPGGFAVIKNSCVIPNASQSAYGQLACDAANPDPSKESPWYFAGLSGDKCEMVLNSGAPEHNYSGCTVEGPDANCSDPSFSPECYNLFPLPTIGRRVLCQLKSPNYTDPVTCCFINEFCTGSTISPYTCSLQFQRLGDDGYCNDPSLPQNCSSCSDTVSQWCGAGNIANPDDIIAKWTSSSYPIAAGVEVNQPCMQAMMRTLYTTEPNTDRNYALLTECNPDILSFLTSSPPINPAGYLNAKRMFTSAVRSYLSNGGKLGGMLGEKGNSTDFNSMVYNVCTSFPGMCTEVLGEWCSSYTPEDLQRNPGLNTFCGCYLPVSIQDSLYSEFGITSECNPFCNIPGVIPLSDGTFSGQKYCDQTVCMINDVTVNLIKSSVQGNITIGNFCNSCSGNPTSGNVSESVSCSCIMNDITITAINSKIGNLNLTQTCGSQQCYTSVKDSSGNIVSKTQVDCNTGEALFGPNVSALTQKKIIEAKAKRNFIIIGVLLLIVIVLIVMYFVINPNFNVPQPKIPIYPKTLPSTSFSKDFSSIYSKK